MHSNNTPSFPFLCFVIGSSGMEHTMFVKKLAEVDSSRDYIIIVDRSASMKLKGRWQEAEEACKVLCSQACKCDADGITLYFFSSHSKTSKGETPAFTKYENVATGEEVMKQFQSKNNEPHGGTDLVTVFKDAFVSLDGKSLSILVITDGMPDEPAEVSELIKETANSMTKPDDILVTIIQVGDDDKADEYLNELDEGLEKLGCKHDIIDVISHKMMLEELNAHGGKFSKVIETCVAKAEETVKVTLPPVPPSELEQPAAARVVDASDADLAAAAARKAQEEADEAETMRIEQEAAQTAEAAGIKAEQEAAAKLKAEEEEATARKAAEDEAARIKAEQEAEAARLKAEEDARLVAEEEARQKAEQEALEAALRRDAMQESMGGLSDAQVKFQNEWDSTISSRSSNEKKCEDDRKTSAANDLKRVGEQNKIKLASKKDSNRTAEQVYLENIESDADNDNEWERVLKLINSSQEPSTSGKESKSDVNRMKSLFIQLKSDPPVPRLSAGNKN